MPARAAGTPRPAVRFAHEIALVIGGAALLFWLLALVSYSAPGSGLLHLRQRRADRELGRPPGRVAGRCELLPARLLGLVVPGGGIACLAGDAGALDARRQRRCSRASSAAGWRSGSAWRSCWCASTGLEWSRLYRLEQRLPDHAGGALGYLVGPAGVQWLGFAGSGLVFVAVGVLGAALVFRFSWAHVAERIGARIESFIESRREKREIAQDLALGVQAARERAGDGAGGAHRGRVAPSHAGADRARAGGCAAQRARGQGAAEAAVHRAARQQAAAGGPARRRPGAPGNRVARDAGDDLAADREEAQGLRRRGARGAGPARPGDHALRDRAGHRREGLAGRQPGQGPGALAVAGVHPRDRDHSRQELHGAGAAQRQAPVDPPVGDPRLAGLQRGPVAC